MAEFARSAPRMASTWVLAATVTLMSAAFVRPASAGEAAPAADNPVREARMMALAAELRCLVCQNQTIADSHADLAQDLRRQIREMLDQGKSEREIMAYMTDRYGDFVLYRPPFKATTALLWAGPALLMIGALGGLAMVLRRRQRLGDDAFDPDMPEEQETAADAPNR